MSVQKPDRRIRRTRQLLHQALMELILEKGYDKITVQDIIDRADVGRSTFYAHYGNIEDLLASGVERLHGSLVPQAAGSKADSHDRGLLPSLELFRHTQEQYPLYKAMIGGGGIDLVRKEVRHALIEHALERLEQLTPDGHQLQVPPLVIATYVAGALETLLTWWLDNKMPYTPEEMDAMFQELAMTGLKRLIDPPPDN